MIDAFSFVLLISLWPLQVHCGEVDTRNVLGGSLIGNFDTGYADQPMVLVRPDGSWLCAATHSPHTEGSGAEAVYTTVSNDRGKTWGQTKPLESFNGEQYAYATLFQSSLPSGRVYVIFVQNYQNVSYDPKYGNISRADMLGGYFLKYSDDNGATWSEQKWRVPVRASSIDAHNDFNGTVKMAWIVDKGFQVGSAAYFAMTKVGTYLVSPPTSTWVLYSPNIATAASPADIQWRTLPDEDHGIRCYNDSRAAAVSSEGHVVPLDLNYFDRKAPNISSAQHLYTVFRTFQGFMGAQISHDAGQSFQDVPTPLAPGAPRSATRSTHPWAAHRVYAGSAAQGLARALKQPRGPQTPRRVPRVSESAADLLMLFYNDGWTNANGW